MILYDSAPRTAHLPARAAVLPPSSDAGYGAVEVWAPLADPVNVAFLKSACGGAITFVAPEPVSEPAARR